MTVHTRWIRRSLALWGGLAAAWLDAAVVEYLKYREELMPELVATTIVALLCGAVLTVRFRAQDDEPFITVQDLHRR